MSHKATNWAIQQRGLKPTTKIVLWHLCDRFNPDYGCFPSQDRLAHDCEISRATLNTHLGLLEQAGLLRRLRRVDPTTRRQLSTRYILAFEDGLTPTPEGPTGATAASGEFADHFPCPDTGHGSNPDNPYEDKGLPEELSDKPCPDSGHGAVSRNQPEPCPENHQSRVQNLDTNLVREPLSKPVKEEEDAQARDSDFDRFFDRAALGAGLCRQRHPARPGGRAGQPESMCAAGSMTSGCPRIGSSRLPLRLEAIIPTRPMGPRLSIGSWNVLPSAMRRMLLQVAAP